MIAWLHVLSLLTAPDGTGSGEPAPERSADVVAPRIERDVTFSRGVEANGADPPPSASTSASSSEPPPRPTRRVGWWVLADVEFGILDRTFATMVGGQAGVVVIDRIRLGPAAYGLVYLDRDYPDEGGRRELRLGYGGGLIGVEIVRSGPVAMRLDTLWAGGRTCWVIPSRGRECDASAPIFVQHTELSIDVTLHPRVGVGVALGYRFPALPRAWDGLDAWSLSGGYLALRARLGRTASPIRTREPR